MLRVEAVSRYEKEKGREEERMRRAGLSTA
jgi:hypothetical protein